MTNEYSRDLRLRSMPIRYKITDRSKPDSLIVMMPSAVSASRQAQKIPTFTRFNWAELWPDSEVLSVADPALPLREGIKGAWFIHPRIDVIKLLSKFIADVAADRNLPLERVCIYGSSLGGFGAIATASLLPGSTAVAEIPQIDVRNWNADSAADIEREIVGGSLEDLEEQFPERINLIERLKHSGRIPAIRLITNARDPQRADQRILFEFVQNTDLPRTGHFDYIVTDEVRGHKPIGKPTAQRLVAFVS